MTRERKMTKVFTTPWISVRVTMSPLAMCETSWPSTASTSSRSMLCSRPVDTATRAEFLNAPVAKALGAPSKIATSGMPMAALSASFFTVETSQYSLVPSEPSITCAPVDIFAIGLEVSSEMMEPPKPMIAENTSREPRLRPCSVRKRSTPRRLATTDSTSSTAKFVRRKSTIRFMGLWFSLVDRLDRGRGVWFQDGSCALLRDDIGGRVGVPGRDSRENRGIDDAQAAHAVHAQLVIDHRQGVLAHLAGAHRVEDGCSRLPGRLFQ